MMGRLLQIITYGRVVLTDESGTVGLVQVEQHAAGAGARRIADKIKRLGQFGLASVPPLGSEALLASLGGIRDQMIAIAFNHQPTRPKGMKPGDTRLYDVRGAMIDFSVDGLVIDAAGLPVTIRNAAKVRAECDVEVVGDVVAHVDGQRISLAALHDAYNAHHHTKVKIGTDVSGPTDKPA